MAGLWVVRGGPTPGPTFPRYCTLSICRSGSRIVLANKIYELKDRKKSIRIFIESTTSAMISKPRSEVEYREHAVRATHGVPVGLVEEIMSNGYLFMYLLSNSVDKLF